MFLGSNVGAQRSGLIRRFDADRINALANHPEIRPTCGGDGVSPLDFSEFVANPKNHAVVWDRGAFLFHWSAPQTYEAHVMVEPAGRGRAAYRTARAGIDYLLAQGAERIWSRVAKGDDRTRHFIVAAGFRECGEDTLDIGFGPVAYTLFQWKKPCLQQS
jgi:hypothetical protein